MCELMTATDSHEKPRYEVSPHTHAPLFQQKRTTPGPARRTKAARPTAHARPAPLHPAKRPARPGPPGPYPPGNPAKAAHRPARHCTPASRPGTLPTCPAMPRPARMNNPGSATARHATRPGKHSHAHPPPRIFTVIFFVSFKADLPGFPPIPYLARGFSARPKNSQRATVLRPGPAVSARTRPGTDSHRAKNCPGNKPQHAHKGENNPARYHPSQTPRTVPTRLFLTHSQPHPAHFPPPAHPTPGPAKGVSYKIDRHVFVLLDC